MEEVPLFPAAVSGVSVLMVRDRWGTWSFKVQMRQDDGSRNWHEVDYACELDREVAWGAASYAAHQALFGDRG